MSAPAPVLLLAQQLTQGGSERQLTEMAKTLDRSQFTPHAGCMRESGLRVAELEQAGVPVARFPLSSFASLQTFRASAAMRRYLVDHRIRIVHSFDAPMNLLAAPVGALTPGVITITSQRAFRQLLAPHLRFLIRVTDRAADAIVINCRALERHLTEEHGVPAPKIHLCYNGIDTEQFQPLPLPQGPRVTIGVVCALRPEKDLATLLRAFLRLQNAGTDAELLIAGDGPARAELEALAGGSRRVRFAPATPRVTERLREMDIFVLPSRSEAFSNSLMEAMACGRAVVASDVGGNPELVEDGRTGVLFPVGDDEALAAHLARLAGNPEERLRLAGAASSHIHANFAVACAARRMGEIYGNLLERHRP